MKKPMTGMDLLISKRMVFLFILCFAFGTFSDYTLAGVSTLPIDGNSSKWSKTGSPSSAQLRINGAFGFPQGHAKILCDRPELRLSVYNSDNWLYLQAILWTDGDDSIDKTKGKAMRDYSTLMFHVGGGPKRTANKDRNYVLNPYLGEGLYFTVQLSENSSTPLIKDAEQRGAIRYISISDGGRIRIDSYSIPLTDLELNPGDTLDLAFFAYSLLPNFTINSADSMPYRASHMVPVNSYHRIVLEKGNPVEFSTLPRQ